MVTELQIQSFFFRAMLAGWASSPSSATIPAMPGYSAIPFRDGDLVLLDYYCTNSHTKKSAGTTTIWHNDEPVWIMHYRGYYEDAVVPFLKRALLHSYTREEWRGGRGPTVLVEGSHVYSNAFFGGFEKFEGREAIFDTHGRGRRGIHEYAGMSLL